MPQKSKTKVYKKYVFQDKKRGSEISSEYSQTSPFFRQSPIMTSNKIMSKYEFWEQASKNKPMNTLTKENEYRKQFQKPKKIIMN
jgi:hypothetical protein